MPTKYYGSDGLLRHKIFLVTYLLLGCFSWSAESFLLSRKFSSTGQFPFLPSPSQLRSSPTAYYYQSASQPGNSSGFHTSLAIVPPLAEWDRLQRARHFAGDALFHKWPPALRLFHPFDGNALEVAQVVEELELEEFQITLDTWVIVPHLEAVEASFKASQKAELWDGPTEQEQKEWEEEQAVRELIEREEAFGQEKAKARLNRELEKQGKKGEKSASERKDLFETFRDQQRKLEDFGGPCVLCLEPDLESRVMLQEIREELSMLLSGDQEYFSASSCYSPVYIEEPLFQASEYRPLIPVGSFESLPAAMEVARRLKGLWGEPSTFNVKELHVISNRDEFDIETVASAPLFDDNREATLYSSSAANDVAGESWGCNAKIMLMGEEPDIDDEEEEMDIAAKMERLWVEGEAGGNDISNDYTILDDEEELSDLESWLNNDEDYDEGIQVTIGRTIFYTGEQRFYKGMPASSVVDSKDRSTGDVGSVSGLARRRRTTTRTRAGSVTWDEGEYGRRQSDYLPFSKQEKTKRENRLLDLPTGGFKNIANMEQDEDSEEEDSF